MTWLNVPECPYCWQPCSDVGDALIYDGAEFWLRCDKCSRVYSVTVCAEVTFSSEKLEEKGGG